MNAVQPIADSNRRTLPVAIAHFMHENGFKTYKELGRLIRVNPRILKAWVRGESHPKPLALDGLCYRLALLESDPVSLKKVRPQ